jgi:hypothetical protein
MSKEEAVAQVQDEDDEPDEWYIVVELPIKTQALLTRQPTGTNGSSLLAVLVSSQSGLTTFIS